MQVPLPGQLLRALRLRRASVSSRPAGRALQDADGEGGQELRTCVPGRQRRVVRVRCERRDLVGAPHRSGMEARTSSKLAARPRRRTTARASAILPVAAAAPQAQQVPRRWPVRASGRPRGRGCRPRPVRRPVRDVGGHGDEYSMAGSSWCLLEVEPLSVRVKKNFNFSEQARGVTSAHGRPAGTGGASSVAGLHSRGAGGGQVQSGRISRVTSRRSR